MFHKYMTGIALTLAALTPNANAGEISSWTASAASQPALSIQMIKELKAGLTYEIISQNQDAPENTGVLVRYYLNRWDTEGNQLENRDDDGLNITDPSTLEASNPFLMEILKNTPTGATVKWHLSKDLIPEGTSQYDIKDYIIEVEVKDRVSPIPAPANVAAIPNEAWVTEDGVGILTLHKGSSEHKPTTADDIEVHYTGWQTDGTMIDSSWLREAPNIFPLGRLITGWQKGIIHMKEGETARIWIPGDLAYDLREDRPTAPKGMLVFDVELIRIVGPTETDTP